MRIVSPLVTNVICGCYGTTVRVNSALLKEISVQYFVKVVNGVIEG